MNRPLVSVVIPTYQRAHTLGRAIDGALTQTYESLEVVISDNASTDGTMKLLEQYRDDCRIKVLRHEENYGAIPNWLAAIKASRGEFIKINWSDDWMEPSVVETLVAALMNDDGAGFAFCPQVVHIQQETQEACIPKDDIHFTHLIEWISLGQPGLPVSPGAALLRREDALWALHLASTRLGADCLGRAIGPDVFLLYGALRRFEYGVAVGGTRVHFEGGPDSITMTEESGVLRLCYLKAMDLLVSELRPPSYRARLHLLLGARRFIRRILGKSSEPALQRPRLPGRTWLSAIPRAGWSLAKRGAKWRRGDRRS